MLGYLGNEGWRDLSDYLVHLTGGRHGDGRTALASILSTGVVVPTGLDDGRGVGTVRSVEWLSGTQYAACLSEIPLGWLGRLADRHGHFGVGFTKEYVRSLGGAPVWYLWKDSPAAELVQELVRQAMRRRDASDAIWQITPFIENPGRGDAYRYEFDWEREWRVRDGLLFELLDLQFLFAPKAEHDWVRHVLWEHDIGDMPVFDPTWSMDELQQKLAEFDL